MEQTTVRDLVEMLVIEVRKGNGHMPVHLRIGGLTKEQGGEIERDGELFVEQLDDVVLVEG